MKQTTVGYDAHSIWVTYTCRHHELLGAPTDEADRRRLVDHLRQIDRCPSCLACDEAWGLDGDDLALPREDK